ncbi:hypothetical protein [Paenacidovorax caeni]|uniref:hypothetical protein n=1 Tax=Paenacidovorax caeni TaxID=343013 RepID=UPI000AAA4D32|nr:hypothetical protein [Paenacidovorax caeni]
MITPRSALKFDLFAEASRQHKRDEVGDPLQVIARHPPSSRASWPGSSPGV